MTDTTRRAVLGAGALGAAGLALAACGSSSDSSAESTGQPSAQPSAQPSGPATPGETLVPAADVPVGSGVIVDSGQTQVVVTQPVEGEFVGLSAVCTHQGCVVSQVDSDGISCPCHGSKFSIADGSVLQGPATQPLPAVDIAVDGDLVVLG